MKALSIFIGISISALVGIIVWIILSANENSTIPRQNNEVTSISPDNDSYTSQEVATHNSKSDCWTIIDKAVYNLTDFIVEHPGGEVILKICGVDGTIDFKNQGAPQDLADSVRAENNLPSDAELHSTDARTKLKSYKIGSLAESANE